MNHGNAVGLSSRICRQGHHCPQQPRSRMYSASMGANHAAGSRRRCTQRLLARCSPGNSNKDDTSFSSGTSAPSGVEETSPASDAGIDDETLQLPKDVIEKLRYKVFSFDTFYVTAVENYEADGVLFKGNLRGDPRKAVATMRRRLQEEVDAAFELFLLNDKEDKPVCVVLPARAVEEVEGSGLFEGLAAGLFLAATAATTFSSAGVPLLSLVLGAEPQEVLSPAAFKAAAPGAVSLFALLLVHEAGHRWEAGKQGVKLSAPFFIPAGLGLLGSFGAITRIKSVLPDRESLLRIAAAGPAAGTAAALVAVLVGTGLSVAGLGTVEVEATAFQDSLLMGALGKLVYGPQLELGNSVVLHPLMIAGWAALAINALNCIPAGELDGGRIAFGLWGRRAAGRINAFATVILGIAGIFDTVALYWVLILVFLQRGPVVPQREEISTPDDGNLTALSVALLFLPLLMLLPFPAPITIYP